MIPSIYVQNINRMGFEIEAVLLLCVNWIPRCLMYENGT